MVLTVENQPVNIFCEGNSLHPPPTVIVAVMDVCVDTGHEQEFSEVMSVTQFFSVLIHSSYCSLCFCRWLNTSLTYFLHMACSCWAVLLYITPLLWRVAATFRKCLHRQRHDSSTKVKPKHLNRPIKAGRSFRELLLWFVAEFFMGSCSFNGSTSVEQWRHTVWRYYHSCCN